MSESKPVAASPTAQACLDAGCHDFSDPVVVKQGAHLLHASTEVAISFCRRCGASLWYEWTE